MVNMAGALVGGCSIFCLAPVQDHNKPLEPEERVCYKNCSRGIWLMETFLWIICYLAGAGVSSLAIASGHITILGMLLAGIIKNK